MQDQLAAALDWWREAGVDFDFEDAPGSLLSEPEEQPSPTASAPRKPAREAVPAAPRIGGDPGDYPQELQAFQQWWLNEESLEPSTPSGRIAPSGNAQARLMVIIPMPEVDDREALLSGPQGRLIANMLRAMQVPADQTYLASALPRHMPMADWAQLAENGMGDVLAHHIALAAPERVLILGRDILGLLGLERKQGVQEIAFPKQSIQALASFAPEGLLGNARLRRDLWQRWLDWTGQAR